MTELEELREQVAQLQAQLDFERAHSDEDAQTAAAATRQAERAETKSAELHTSLIDSRTNNDKLQESIDILEATCDELRNQVAHLTQLGDAETHAQVLSGVVSKVEGYTTQVNALIENFKTEQRCDFDCSYCRERQDDDYTEIDPTNVVAVFPEKKSE